MGKEPFATPLSPFAIGYSPLCRACVPHCPDAVEAVADAAAGGVAAATWTAAPALRVSGGLLMIRSDGERPAVTSTLSPKSRPSCTFLRTTLSLLSRVATCVPWLPGTSAVDGILSKFASDGISNCTLQ